MIHKIYAASEDFAYTAGFNCGFWGPSEENCHFSYFRTPQLTAAWEQGKRNGETSRKEP